jgi:hypothetical protein
MVGLALALVAPVVASFAGAEPATATIDSARRHWLGKGGEWKGRIQQQGRA